MTKTRVAAGCDHCISADVAETRIVVGSYPLVPADVTKTRVAALCSHCILADASMNVPHSS